MPTVKTRISIEVIYEKDSAISLPSSRDDYQFVKAVENAIANFRGKDGVRLISFGNPKHDVLQFICGR